MLRDGRTTEELGESLVVHLRTRLDAPALALEDPLRTITGGYANPIYRARLRDAPPPFDRELVIRADGRGSGPERLGREFEIHRFVHDHGYPTAEPIHFEPDGQVLGSPFVMMAWLDGTTPWVGASPKYSEPGLFRRMVDRVTVGGAA